VYLDRRHVGDRVVPSEAYAFRRLPAAGEKLWWLDPERSGPVADHAPAVGLTVTGARETGEREAGRYYVADHRLEFVFLRPAGGPARRDAWLDFAAIPLPGAAPCEFELVDALGRRQRAVLAGPRWLRFHVALAAGKNVYVLQLRSASQTGPLAMLQSLSLESGGAPLATDPVPAGYLP
jgi:hypothetical protein